MVVETLHNDRIKEATRNRLPVELREARPGVEQSYNPALAWIGERIKDIGSRIVEISGQPEQSLN